MWFGNGKLWTVLWPEGMVFVPPDDIRRDGTLVMKFPWWRGRGVRGPLSITGEELAIGVAVSARTGGYGLTGFNASSITFPVAGCYGVTGRAGDVALSFVTLVRPCSALLDLPSPSRKRYAICD
jgi:hypothetical protein